MSDTTIHVCANLSDEILELGRDMLPAGFRLERITRDDLLGRLDEPEYLMVIDPMPGPLSDEQMASMRRLKLIQLMGVGYDAINVEGARKARIPVALNGGANAISVAEHTVMLILALIKRLNVLDRNVRGGVWRGGSLGQFKIHEVWSQTVGIVGLGRIGQEVSRRLRPFEPGEIVYYDPFRQTPEREQQLGVRYLQLDDLLKVSDIVTVHVPLSDDTRHLIGARALKLMKPNAVVINTSRGGLIDEMALVDALKDGTIAGAGLDVFSQEPPPNDHPLFALDNVLLTPHMAGPTWESYPRRFTNCFENIERVARGETPQWVIPELSDLVPRPARR